MCGSFEKRKMSLEHCSPFLGISWKVDAQEAYERRRERRERFAARSLVFARLHSQCIWRKVPPEVMNSCPKWDCVPWDMVFFVAWAKISCVLFQLYGSWNCTALRTRGFEKTVWLQDVHVWNSCFGSFQDKVKLIHSTVKAVTMQGKIVHGVITEENSCFTLRWVSFCQTDPGAFETSCSFHFHLTLIFEEKNTVCLLCEL